MKKIILGLGLISSIVLADEWSDIGVKTKDIANWKKVNSNSYYISKWIEVGVTSPIEALHWKNNGIDANWVKHWKKSGINNPDEAKKWLEYFGSYYNSKDWFDEGITDFAKAKSWEQAVTYPVRAKEWLKYGLTTDDVKKYKDVNVAIKASREKPKNYSASKNNPMASQKWQDIGVKTKHEVRDWENIGSDLSDTKRYLKIGLKTPNEVMQWKGWDIYTLEEIFQNKDKLGISSLQEFKNWQTQGISQGDIKMYKSLGLKTPNEAKEWLKTTNLRSNQVKKWIKIGFKNPNNIKQWYQATNGDYSKAKKWIDIGIKDSKKMLSYKKQGFNINDIKIALKLKISLAKLSKWKKIGVKTRNISKWFTIKIYDPKEAQEWLSLNIPIPQIIKGLRKTEYSTPKKFKSICSKNMNLVHLIKSNSYNNINSCVTGCFLIKQVLSKNKAFGYTNLRSRYNKAVIINADGNLNNDFSRGSNVCGVFKITDTKKIELRNNKTTTASVLKRLSLFSLR